MSCSLTGIVAPKTLHNNKITNFVVIDVQGEHEAYTLHAYTYFTLLALAGQTMDWIVNYGLEHGLEEYGLGCGLEY